MKIYKYIGDGAGIPGLPHEIPEDQAESYGNQFKSALEAGLYQLAGAGSSRPIQDEKPRKPKKADDTSAEGD